MRLAEFISTNTEAILDEWVAFAETCGPAAGAMTLQELRDHAVAMLRQIVNDLNTPQTDAQQDSKSKGQAVAPVGTPATAAEVHGSGRAESGFTVGEMVSEYRALRASVIRLWTRDSGTLDGDDLQDLMRFNEAIDQSLAESISRYSGDIDRSRETFLAILGHDLRTPLGAVITSSQFMLDTGDLDEPHRTLTTRIARSARRMNSMVADLLDYTRSRLGAGIPIVRKPMDIGKEVAHAVEEVGAAHPECSFHLETSGDLEGSWDCERLSQVMSNLLGNAVQHGARGNRVTITMRGEEDHVMIRVHNRGATISPDAMEGLFSPFKRMQPGVPSRRGASMGLGLYIAERVVAAHDGTIHVTSTETAGTAFTLTLPRQPQRERADVR